ncbi:hypothetical protein ATY41_07125 [Leifsonia xyli subsp. xyli]|uniref:Uncharacterized protein n=1 Tax=Leifsonia xyli subsp. xyli TaxID=59736 RepID=A0A1E2SMI6_LEIXY|nr:hypothetical protein ATY41_07125 [Leifsonia xyli subsp. xyli]
MWTKTSNAAYAAASSAPLSRPSQATSIPLSSPKTAGSDGPSPTIATDTPGRPRNEARRSTCFSGATRPT